MYQFLLVVLLGACRPVLLLLLLLKCGCWAVAWLFEQDAAAEALQHRSGY